MNESELRNLMYTAQLDEIENPFVIRYPRGQGIMPIWETPFEKIEIGTGRKIKSGNDLAILSIGHPGNFVVQACEKLSEMDIDVAHYDMRFVKPLDASLMHEIGKKYRNIITIEDGTIVGGFGSAVLEFLNEHDYDTKVNMLGVPDKVIEHGSQTQQYTECGYDIDSIVATAKGIFEKAKQGFKIA